MVNGMAVQSEQVKDAADKTDNKVHTHRGPYVNHDNTGSSQKGARKRGYKSGARTGDYKARLTLSVHGMTTILAVSKVGDLSSQPPLTYYAPVCVQLPKLKANSISLTQSATDPSSIA